MAAATRWKLVRATGDGLNMGYYKGQIVGYVDVNQLRGPIETPMPQKWYVLMTFPNKEAKVMRTFKDRNISAYHPVIRKARIIRGRRNDITAPLFATLIFNYFPYLPQCAPPIKLAQETWQSRYVRKDENRVPDMVGIRQLEAVGNIPVARRRRLCRIGQLVRVVGGPFASFNGMIERLDSQGRLTVLLDIFSRLTPVELDEGQIEAA